MTTAYVPVSALSAAVTRTPALTTVPLPRPAPLQHTPPLRQASLATPASYHSADRVRTPHWVVRAAAGLQEGRGAALNRTDFVDRVVYCDSVQEIQDELAAEGDKLVVIEVLAVDHEGICETGLSEEAELHWKEDRKQQLKLCAHLKSNLKAVAAECPDIKFLLAEVDSHNDDVCSFMDVTVLPSLLFYVNGRKMWEHRGALNLEQELGEGVLYYGDTGGSNEKASQYVEELATLDDIARFTGKQPSQVLSVVDVSSLMCEPCIHVYPSVVALAKSFTGYAAFARLMGEEDDEFAATLGQLKVDQVPTFLFFRDGQEVGRHVGSSRGDLIGKILALQESAGVLPPTPKHPRRTSPNRR